MAATVSSSPSPPTATTFVFQLCSPFSSQHQHLHHPWRLGLLHKPSPSRPHLNHTSKSPPQRATSTTTSSSPVAISTPQARQRPPAHPRNAPPLLRLAVSAVTELLRIFTNTDTPEKSDDTMSIFSTIQASPTRVKEVMDALQADYQQSYFLTGNFTISLYAEDCYFADPTIGFTGRDIYERNLKLLVPFFQHPTILLVNIEEGLDGGTCYIKACWRLRTYLKLPWRPLVAVDGSTVYTLNDKLKIVKHIESWNISASEAILQLFVPSQAL